MPSTGLRTGPTIDIGTGVFSSDLEHRTIEIGHELFAAVRDSKLTESAIDRWFMQLGMGDPALKTQLFRFVDVLAALQSPADVDRHLREYLGSSAESVTHGHLKWWQRRAAAMIPEHGPAAWVLARFARGATRRMARRFIAASTVQEAIGAVGRLRKQNLAFTIDLLGEAVLSESEAERYQARYLELITTLADAAEHWPPNELLDADDERRVPPVNLSVKLSSLFSRFDPIDPVGTSAAVRERLRPILRLARRRGAFIHIDMEQQAFKDVTLQIVRDVFSEAEFRDWPDVGVVIQAYLRQSADDLRDMAEWAKQRGTPITIRLVKGAYWDFETITAAQRGWPVPVFEQKAQSDANFESLTDFLIDHREHLRVAIASHNVRSIAHALARAEQCGVPPSAIEFQMLYGMADQIKSALVQRGQRVRVYTPFGELLPGMAYLVRRLLENTSNESFLRAGFADHVPEEKLLMNPLDLIRNAPAKARASDEFRNEPLTDFNEPAARSAMIEALKQVRGDFGRTVHPIIDGRTITSGERRQSIDPSNRARVVGHWIAASKADANHAIATALAATEAWRETSAETRADHLRKLAAILRRRRFELAAWEVYETAKPWREADADLAEAIDFCEFYAHEMLQLAAAHRLPGLPGESNRRVLEPRGVTVVIAPWNFPLAILCGMTTAALVTGNPVILKPAEQSTIIGARFMEALLEAGLPPRVVQFLPGDGEAIGPTLVQHPDVATIVFTGSRAVGLQIQKSAAITSDGQDHVKRVITEMGGKNAIIVDDDADLDEAIAGIVASAFGYAGQKCSACSRVIALDSIYDVLIRRLVEATSSLRVGIAHDPATTVPAVIGEEARRRINAAIEKGKSQATLAYSGELGTLADVGSFVAPHIFADVPPDSSLAQDEIFGPALSVLRARNLNEALSIANGTKYALTGGIYSRSPAHLEDVQRRFRVGNLYVNRKITGALVGRQPFGGFKLSGIGSQAGGREYLQQFMLPRTITENTLRRGFAPEE